MLEYSNIIQLVNMGILFSSMKFNNYKNNIKDDTNYETTNEDMNRKIDELEKYIQINNDNINNNTFTIKLLTDYNNKLQSHIQDIAKHINKLYYIPPDTIVRKFINDKKMEFIKTHSLEETLLINMYQYIITDVIYVIKNIVDKNIVDKTHVYT